MRSLRWQTVRAGCVASIVVVATAGGVAGQDLPEWTLGAASLELDGGETPFFRVAGAQFLPDGSVAVADAGNARVAVFAVSGELLRSLGREGEGPGEFRSLSHLFVFEDTIVAYDQVNLRFTLWDGTDAPPQTWRYLAYGDCPTP